MLTILSVGGKGEILALLTSLTVLPLIWTGSGSAQIKAVALVTNDHQSGDPFTEFVNLMCYIQQKSFKMEGLRFRLLER